MSTRGGKLVSLILAGACAVLFLLAIALQVGLGRGYSWLQPETDTAAVSAGNIDRTPFKLPAETEFAATQARPLFNEDRKPTPDEPDDTNAAPPPPSVPLNIALTGIVLTPELRLAMVQDKSKNNAVALKEGMPMPGDQGGWTLTKINNRSAIFREASGEEIEVELTTAVANPKPNAPGKPGAPGVPNPPKMAANPAAAAAPNPAGAPPPQPNQQEALQHRIEERRKQMREEAERLKQQNVSPEQMRQELQHLKQPPQQ
jgi:general secretion pathway protein N